MPRYQEAKREKLMNETRQRLLKAATSALALDGFDKANVNSIAEQAGYSIGTFYNYFPSKRDLVHAVIDAVSLHQVDAISDIVNKGNDPTQKLALFFQAGFEFVEDHTLQAKAIFNILNGPDQEFKDRLFQAYLPLFDLLGADILLQGVNQGLFREVDIPATANLLMFLYLGVGSQLNRDGKLWLQASQVSEFVLYSLLVSREVRGSG